MVAGSIFFSDQGHDNWTVCRSEINPNASHWHWWSWLTRVTLMVGSSCCPPHLTPPTPTSLLPSLTQFMSKLDWRQRSQCGTGEKTRSYFYFSVTKSSSSFFSNSYLKCRMWHWFMFIVSVILCFPKYQLLYSGKEKKIKVQHSLKECISPLTFWTTDLS